MGKINVGWEVTNLDLPDNSDSLNKNQEVWKQGGFRRKENEFCFGYVKVEIPM